MRALRSILVCCAAALASIAVHAQDTVDYAGLGKVAILRPSSAPQSVVLFVSGDGGWNQGVVDMAKHLVDKGALVAGIDIRQMRNHLLGTSEACVYPAGVLETFSHFIQQKYGVKRYQNPVLVGYSSGATLVYGVLAQAPSGTFAGALSLGFCPDLEWTKPLCRGEGLEHDPFKPQGFKYRPATRLHDPWIALQGDQDQVCDARQTRDFVGEVPGAQVVLLPSVGHGYSVERNWLPQFRDAFDRISASSSAARAPLAAEVRDLPLVEIPATRGTGDTFAVILSGDGGWAGLDKEVANELAADGMPVVGWDSLRYFWDPRTPEGAARDLERVVRHYARAWHRSRVVLIGYSQGADTLPFMVNRLPDDVRRMIRTTVLLGLSAEAFFEFHVTHWLGTPTGGVPTGPELGRGQLGPVLCIYGAEESDSPCRGLQASGMRKVELQGGHHFGGDYASVAKSILSALPP